MGFENVAVTGGAGLLGSHVMRRLHGRGNLTAVDIKAPHETDRHLGTFIEANITDYDAMRRAFAGKDAVIHLAAIPNPREAAAGVTFNTNVQGAWTVLQAAEDAGVRRIVVASSDSVFGLSFNPPGWVPQFLPVDETHPSRPTEFYSLSKKVTETIAESFAARGKLEVLAIRPSHIVFPRGYPEIEKRGADVQNYHFWAWVAPEDVAQAFDLALNVATYSGYEMFAIAAADGMNTRPTLEMAEERWGKLPPIRRPEVYARNPMASVIDISKARDALGYQPAIDRAGLLARARA